jgi:long-chain acyl-CoA synthetase
MRTAADVPLRYNAVDILECNLDARAEEVALYSRERTMTFQRVADEVNQVGNALVNQFGVRLGEFVALLCLDQPEWVTSFFGIVKAGGIAVSINTMVTPRVTWKRLLAEKELDNDMLREVARGNW